MDRLQIVQELKDDRDRLERAIRILETGSTSGNGKLASASGKRSHGITAEGRRRLSEMMKKRWAARRRAKKAA
jgi:hypothetical protein